MVRAIGTVVAAGVAYGVIGLAFGAAANGQATTQGRFGWRLAAWVVSGVVFAAHIGYAQLRGRSGSARTAVQSAVGAALGAFVLAIAATAHAVSIGANNLASFGLALVLWPAGTMVAACVVALVLAMGIAFVRRRV